MMGFERNCDVVEMSSYAPLFGKIGCEQWKPDLIWFNNLRAFTTPNYHVQKMFGNNLPSIYIPSAASDDTSQSPKDFHQVCGFDKATGEYVVKCVNLAADRALDLVVDFGAELPAGKIKVETLTGDPKVVNDMANPERCRPEAKSVAFAGGREFKTNLPASSLTIIRAKK
jgi:alpha-L-arabinofuranosidase